MSKYTAPRFRLQGSGRTYSLGELLAGPPEFARIVAQVIAQRRCLLCGRPEISVIGVLRVESPEDARQFGPPTLPPLPPGKTRIMPYALCAACGADLPAAAPKVEQAFQRMRKETH